MGIEIAGVKTEMIHPCYEGTVETAVNQFRKDHPGFRIEYIDGQLVIDFCEVCECPLFEDSDYHESEDGVTWCKSHDAPEEPADG